MIHINTIRGNLRTILYDIPALKHNSELYFNTNEPPYSPAGYARAIGFSSFRQLKTVVARLIEHIVTNQDGHNNPDNPDSILFNPPPWFTIIHESLSIIEDDLFKKALLDEYRSATVHYAMGAYFDTVPTQKSETHTTSTNQTKIQVVLPSTTPSENIEEVSRLKRALPEINQLDQNSTPSSTTVTEEELSSIL